MAKNSIDQYNLASLELELPERIVVVADFKSHVMNMQRFTTRELQRRRAILVEMLRLYGAELIGQVDRHVTASAEDRVVGGLTRSDIDVEIAGSALHESVTVRVDIDRVGELTADIGVVAPQLREIATSSRNQSMPATEDLSPGTRPA